VANYAYLCTTNVETIYPAFADEFYDPAISTVARCERNVPLMWFALFRRKDLVTHTFSTDDGPYVVTAPITSRDHAIRQLEQSVPRLEALFAGRGRLSDYASLLVKALRDMDSRYLTIEWDEIDVITEGGLLAEASAAMASLDPTTPPNPVMDRKRLLRLSGIGRRDQPFPAAKLAINPDTDLKEESFLHSRLIGSSYLRPVPWES
jgi:hypothetical protein